MRIAYIGLGSMGAPQARLLAAAADVELAVFDPFPAALAPFEGKARLAASPADAARDVDVACICVRDDGQVETVIFGPDGLTDTLSEGALVLVHSTIRIDSVHRLAARLAEQGVILIDAPVSRTRQTEDQPFVATMMGGAEADCERARPVVSIYSTDVQRVGGLGAGMALKIANNMVSWTSIVLGTTLVRLAEGYGVPLDALRTTMKANGNLTPVMEAGMAVRLQRDDPSRAALMESQAGIGEKDMALAIDIGEAVGADMSTSRAVRRQVRAAMTSADA